MSVCLSAARLYIPVRSPVCLSVCHTSVFCRHIRNFYRATHMHSADYAVATCLSDRSYLCLSDSLSVYHTTGLPPCTHEFLSSFVSVFQYTYLSITFIRTMSSIYVCVCYIRAPSSQYMSVCLAVHSSKFCQCL